MDWKPPLVTEPDESINWVDELPQQVDAPGMVDFSDFGLPDTAGLLDDGGGTWGGAGLLAAGFLADRLVRRVGLGKGTGSRIKSGASRLMSRLRGTKPTPGTNPQLGALRSGLGKGPPPTPPIGGSAKKYPLGRLGKGAGLAATGITAAALGKSLLLDPALEAFGLKKTDEDKTLERELKLLERKDQLERANLTELRTYTERKEKEARKDKLLDMVLEEEQNAYNARNQAAAAFMDRYERVKAQEMQSLGQILGLLK